MDVSYHPLQLGDDSTHTHKANILRIKKLGSKIAGMDGKAFFHGMGQGVAKPKTTGRGNFPELPPPHSARKAPRGAEHPSLPDAHVLKMFQIAKNVSNLVIL